MAINSFLQSLFESGIILLAADETLAFDDRDRSLAILADAERRHRLDVPGHAPAWNPQVSLWAATLLREACRLLADRQLGPADVAKLLSVPPPAQDTPSACYSADIVFRALGDVLKLARRISTEDPLTVRLLELARAWPLSSVGIENVGVVNVSGFVNDPCLRRTYAERVIAHNDIDRLDHPAVRDEVRLILGAYASKAPSIAKRIAALTETAS